MNTAPLQVAAKRSGTGLCTCRMHQKGIADKSYTQGTSGPVSMIVAVGGMIGRKPMALSR